MSTLDGRRPDVMGAPERFGRMAVPELAEAASGGGEPAAIALEARAR